METVSIPSITPTNAPDAATLLNSLENDTYKEISPPPYIPTNLGAAAKSREALVLHLLNLFNAQGRTVVSSHFQYICNTSAHEACSRTTGRGLLEPPDLKSSALCRYGRNCPSLSADYLQLLNEHERSYIARESLPVGIVLYIQIETILKLPN